MSNKIKMVGYEGFILKKKQKTKLAVQKRPLQLCVSSLLEARVSYLHNTPQTSLTVRMRCWQRRHEQCIHLTLCVREFQEQTPLQKWRIWIVLRKKKVLFFLLWKHVVLLFFFCSVGLIGVIWGERKHSLLIKTLAFTLILLHGLVTADIQCLWERLWFSKHSHMSPKGTLSPLVPYIPSPSPSPAPSGSLTSISNLIISVDDIMGSVFSPRCCQDHRDAQEGCCLDGKNSLC